IDALEAYLRVQPPSGTGIEPAISRASPELEAIATRILDEPATEPPRPLKTPTAPGRRTSPSRPDLSSPAQWPRRPRDRRGNPGPVERSCPGRDPFGIQSGKPSEGRRMPNAKVLAGSNRLEQSARALREHWLATEATWSDVVRHRFEERHLAPLE